MTDHLRLTAAEPADVAPERRTITGVLCTYGSPSSTNRVQLSRGSLTPRDPLSRVKLLLDHDHTQPVGYLTEVAETDAGMTGTFYLPEGDAGTAALEAAAAGIRDGLSVGFAIADHYVAPDGTLHVTSGELYEVSLVSVPDFPDAQVTTVIASAARKDNPRMETEEQTPAPAPEAPAEQPAPQPAPVELAAGPSPVPQAAPVAEVQPRPITLAAAITTMSSAINTGSPDAIKLALADILPAQDAGKAWLRDGWLGELWKASHERRPWIDAFGQVQQLDSITGKGWEWTKRPKPASYEGNKTEVPTGDIKTKATTFTAERWAGGWDIDRIFLDLGDPGFLDAFWRAAMEEYRAESNKSIAKKVIAQATAKTSATAGGALAAIKLAARELRTIGASASTILVSPALFDEYADLTADQVPFWMRNASATLDLRDDTASLSGLTIAADPELDAKTLVAIDSRAAVIRERQPIQVKAYDVARAGVDLGFYSYGRFDLHDKRAIVKVTVTG